MKRASKPQLAQRINRAFLLLEQQVAPQLVIQIVKEEFSVSQIQAYRYVQQARKLNTLLPVPEPTRLFTTKLPHDLIERLKRIAKSIGIPINHLISQALEDFLKKQENGQKKEEQTS